MLASNRHSGIERTIDTELVIRESTGQAREQAANPSAGSAAIEPVLR
jgi:hypothetical protein